MIKNIFFDLDGTLIDSSKGIIKGFEYALSFFNKSVNKKIEKYKIIGPPLRESFEKYYNINSENVDYAIKKYREYYSENGIYENELYAGIKEMLIKFKKQNYNLIIVTSKPTEFVEKILIKHKIIDCFNFISGSTLNGTREKKKDIIKYAIDKLNINDTNSCIMVGDKAQDVLGARDNNIKTIGVTYGFGTLSELEEVKSDYIVKSVAELEDFLMYILNK